MKIEKTTPTNYLEWPACPEAALMGIDGARGGWVVATHYRGALTLSFHTSLSSITFAPPARGLIDMPIGLPASGKRPCDELARGLLGTRRSTLFPVPSRSAVYATSYTACCDTNSIEQGCRVSKQAWNITPKIRELDLFLRDEPARHSFIAEAHPELAFKALAPSAWPLAPKRTPEGRAAREQILSEALNAPIVEIVGEFLVQHPKHLDHTDAYDALSLCAVLAVSRGQVSFVGTARLTNLALR